MFVRKICTYNVDEIDTKPFLAFVFYNKTNISGYKEEQAFGHHKFTIATFLYFKDNLTYYFPSFEKKNQIDNCFRVRM